MDSTDYATSLVAHYREIWKVGGVERRWTRGPVKELSPEFCVLEHPPGRVHAFWIYATCGMSEPEDEEPLELHLFSPVRSDQHVELLYAIAHFHATGATLGLGHTVNFGRPWLDESQCTHGLISLPYLDGPRLEHFGFTGVDIRCLWLVPVTRGEVEFKKRHGVDRLEEKLEQAGFNYLDPNRPTVVTG